MSDWIQVCGFRIPMTDHLELEVHQFGEHVTNLTIECHSHEIEVSTDQGERARLHVYENEEDEDEQT